MMSLVPIFLDGTFMTSETGTEVPLLMPSISSTRMACPAGMWSITVPLRMAVTRRMLCSCDIKHHLR